MKKFRNFYACAAVASVLITYSIYVYRLFFWKLIDISAISPLLPVLVFISVTLGIFVANWVFLIALSVFDRIAKFLMKGGDDER